MINFFRIRKIAYIASTAFILTGFFFIYQQQGLNFGIGFTGGRSFVIESQKPFFIPVLEKQLKKAFDNKSTQVKTHGSTNTLRISTSYMLNKNDEATNQKIKNKLIKTIEKTTGSSYVESTSKQANSFEIKSIATIGAVVANDEIQAGILATIIALFIILFYLLMRFRKWQITLSTVIALMHDLACVIASFGIARQLGFVYEINTNIVGSLLASIGYSCNNSVVIYNRLKSLVKDLGDLDMKKLGNMAINQTLTRTIITSSTTLMAVIPLFILAEETLKGFCFCMIVIILVGTWSSFFVVTLSYDLKRMMNAVNKKIFLK